MVASSISGCRDREVKGFSRSSSTQRFPLLTPLSPLTPFEPLTLQAPSQQSCDPLSRARALSTAAEAASLLMKMRLFLRSTHDEHSLVLHCAAASTAVADDAADASLVPCIQNLGTRGRFHLNQKLCFCCCSLLRDTVRETLYIHLKCCCCRRPHAHARSHLHSRSCMHSLA